MNKLTVNTHVLHIYQRSKEHHDIYRCLHPDCTHYNKRSFIIGKRAECGKCGGAFIIDAKQVKGGKQIGNKNLVCIKCSKSPKGKVVTEDLSVAENIMDEILQEEFKEKFAIPEFKIEPDEHEDKIN